MDGRAGILKIRLFKTLFVALLFMMLISSSLSAQTIDTLPKGYVILIIDVIAKSPAEKAGIKAGDIIYSLNNKVFYNVNYPSLLEDFSSFVKSLPEDSYELAIIRKGEKITKRIKLSSPSSSPRLGITMELLENDAEVYFNRAVNKLATASTREDLKVIAKEFEKAKALSPEWSVVYYNLGLVYEKLDYYDKAVENFSEYLGRLVRVHAPSEDVEKITVLIGKNKKKAEKLEDFKNKMVQRELHHKKEIPAASRLLSSCDILQFKFDRDGNMWMRNPLAYSKHNDPLIKKNVRKYPWLKVKFDGKFFEVRGFELFLGEFASKPMFTPFFILYKGEINVDSFTPFIIIRKYTFLPRDVKDAYVDVDSDVAFESAFQKLPNIEFDKERFRFECHYEIE